MSTLTQQIIIEARKYIGVIETSHNSGPYIDAWLRRVHRQPGEPWRAAFAWCMLDDACDSLGLHNPLPPVAGGHLLMRMAMDHCAWMNEPGPGFLFGVDHGVDEHGNHLSHVGIVVGLDGDALRTVEGNTNATGSREGNCVAARARHSEVITLGYLDPDALLDNSRCR